MACKGVDVAFLLGSIPRKQGMIRYDFLSKNMEIFKEHGKSLDKYAKKIFKC
jgi:malate/lactate dehydrogenase